MKAEWRRAGHATGVLRCKLALPAIETEVERLEQGDNAVLRLRRFIQRHMPTAPDALINGSFVISAEMRAQNMSTRWTPLCRWRGGEGVEATLSRATEAWAHLPKEKWPGGYETRILAKQRAEKAEQLLKTK